MRRASLLWLALSLAACKPGVDPDHGRYSCTTTADCGPGYDCVAQFAGGGRCFKTGECKAEETCDGTDENCDGRVDETFPGVDAGCLTGAPGACAAGHLACLAGTQVCAQTTMGTLELCNGLDDNCDGRTDESFDLTSDNANCGACGQGCDAGTSCLSSSCHETSCADGVDNDQNGQVDCLDPSCFALECSTAMLPPFRCGLLEADGGADAGLDGGADGGADAGVRGCFMPEADCANGLDDDGDGLVDCEDPDCDGRNCFSGTVCTMRMCPGPG